MLPMTIPPTQPPNFGRFQPPLLVRFASARSITCLTLCFRSLEAAAPSCAGRGHGRRVVRMSELMKLKLAKHAQLTQVELLAIVLHTGPMGQVSQRVLADNYPS